MGEEGPDRVEDGLDQEEQRGFEGGNPAHSAGQEDIRQSDLKYSEEDDRGPVSCGRGADRQRQGQQDQKGTLSFSVLRPPRSLGEGRSWLLRCSSSFLGMLETAR